MGFCSDKIELRQQRVSKQLFSMLLILVNCLVWCVTFPVQAQTNIPEQILFHVACPSNYVPPLESIYIVGLDGMLEAALPPTLSDNYVWLEDGRVSFTQIGQSNLIVYAVDPYIQLEENIPPLAVIASEDYANMPEIAFPLPGRLSPDGRYYAFATEDVPIGYDESSGESFIYTDTNNLWIYVLNISTGDMHIAGRYAQGHRDIAWSIDSTQLAFIEPSGEIRVAYITQLPNTRDAYQFPANTVPYVLRDNLTWSPDNNWIAYVDTSLDPHLRYQVRIQNSGDGQDILLYESFDMLFAPTWSPDSTRILVPEYHDNGSQTQLLMITLDPLVVQPINSLQVMNNRLAWSPDGNWIAAATLDTDTGSNTLSVMRLDGSDAFTLVDIGMNGTIGEIQWRQGTGETELGVGDLAEVYVLDDGLSLRDAPSVSATLLERMPAGTQVQIVGDTVVAEGYRWWQIETDGGVVGWSVERADGVVTLRRVAADADTSSWTIPSVPLVIGCDR